MRRIMLIIVLLAIAATLGASPAVAIFPPTADGEAHPNVGALVYEWQTPGVKDQYCSGTLIAPGSTSPPRIVIPRSTVFPPIRSG